MLNSGTKKQNTNFYFITTFLFTICENSYVLRNIFFKSILMLKFLESANDLIILLKKVFRKILFFNLRTCGSCGYTRIGKLPKGVSEI